MRFNKRLSIISVICITAFIALVFFVRSLVRFAHIFGEHPGVAVTQQETWDRYYKADSQANLTAQIPKRIHQIYHNWKDPSSKEPLPKDWEDIRQTCIQKQPDWEYTLWENGNSRSFIEKEYSWFLKTYDGYPHPVQRVDALKYFLMLHYGGFYIDLDNGCLESLEPLRYYSTWITDGGHGTLSNNIIGSAPAHPFYEQVVSNLIPWSWDYLLPYATVHYGSGQWFLGAMWDKYHDLHPDEPLTRIVMDMRPGSPPWVYFNVGRGGTWGSWDNKWFDWFGNRLIPQIMRNLGLIILVGAVSIAGLVGCCILCRRRRKQEGYALVGTEDIELGARPT